MLDHIRIIITKEWFYCFVIDSQFETDEFCNKIYNNIRCENGGLLERIEKGYVCKCTNDYYGENCTNGTYWINYYRLYTYCFLSLILCF